MSIYSVARHAVLLLPITALLCNAQEVAPKNELGFTLGGIPSLSRSTTQASLDAGAGSAFGVNYGRRFLGGNKVALYGEINFLASPLRDVLSDIGSATKNFASLYITPGVRLKLFPAHAISPYVLIGGGYADYEQSTTVLNGQSNNIASISGGQNNVAISGGFVVRWH